MVLIIPTGIFECKINKILDFFISDYFPRGPIEGCKDYQYYLCDSDRGINISSCQLPPGLSNKDIMLIVQKYYNDYSVFSETQSELILRRPYTPFIEDGFNEYRFYIDDKRQLFKMNYLISGQEDKIHYRTYLDKFRKLHR